MFRISSTPPISLRAPSAPSIVSPEEHATGPFMVKLASEAAALSARFPSDDDPGEQNRWHGEIRRLLAKICGQPGQNPLQAHANLLVFLAAAGVNTTVEELRHAPREVAAQDKNLAHLVRIAREWVVNSASTANQAQSRKSSISSQRDGDAYHSQRPAGSEPPSLTGAFNLPSPAPLSPGAMAHTPNRGTPISFGPGLPAWGAADAAPETVDASLTSSLRVRTQLPEGNAAGGAEPSTAQPIGQQRQRTIHFECALNMVREDLAALGRKVEPLSGRLEKSEETRESELAALGRQIDMLSVRLEATERVLGSGVTEVCDRVTELEAELKQFAGDSWGVMDITGFSDGDQ